MPTNLSTKQSNNLDPTRCAILVPTFSAIEQPCEIVLRELEQRGYCVRRSFGNAAIDQARNLMATAALNDGFDELLWIDSDVSFDPDAVEQIRSHQLPIVAGIYPKKGCRAIACEVLPETQEIVFGNEGGLVPIRYAATGFLLTQRRVYESIQQTLNLPLCNQGPVRGPAFYPFFQPMTVPDTHGPWYLGEDYSFCERARQAGFDIVADSSLRLFHHGRYPYGWEDAGSGTTRYSTYRFRIEPID